MSGFPLVDGGGRFVNLMLENDGGEAGEIGANDMRRS